MTTCLVVHGGLHGGWCWEEVIPLLESAEHRAIAPDLPGMGDDPTPPAHVDLKLYADKIVSIVARGDRRQGRFREHPANTPALAAIGFQPISLPITQPDRALIQQTQAFNSCGNAIRKARRQIHLLRAACLNQVLAVA